MLMNIGIEVNFTMLFKNSLQKLKNLLYPKLEFKNTTIMLLILLSNFRHLYNQY